MRMEAPVETAPAAPVTGLSAPAAVDRTGHIAGNHGNMAK
jgi:hypothetical protein